MVASQREQYRQGLLSTLDDDYDVGTEMYLYEGEDPYKGDDDLEGY